MRVLLAGCPYIPDCLFGEINAYLNSNTIVVVNMYSWTLPQQLTVQKVYEKHLNVSFECFDSSIPELLLISILNNYTGFDAIVCSPHVQGLTRNVLQSVITNANLQHKLRAIGCPNASISHLSSLSDFAAQNNIAIIHTPDVHAESVAEYTLSQIGFHARRTAYFYDETGRNGSWPHNEALATTHLLQGKTLGVVGGSGKDGAAVISLAIKLGLHVVSISSGSAVGVQKIQKLGAVVAPNIESLLSTCDYLSINSRVVECTQGLIGTREIELMKKGVIIINPSGAEIFDKQAIIQEFHKPQDERQIGVLVLDMPFGGKRDSQAFLADADNTLLKQRGVLFTPRMAGYTAEGRLQAVTELAGYLNRYLRLNDQYVPIANQKTSSSKEDTLTDDVDALLADIISFAHQAGAEAIRLREAGLIVHYKEDGSPATNADIASETILKDGLRKKGYTFRFLGEESREWSQEINTFDVVIDGIDGTRNFRDGNYGWCVSIAVRMNDDTLIGVVHDPQSKETYFAVRERGAFIQLGGLSKRCTIPHALPNDFSFSVGSFRVAGSTAIKRQIIDDIKQLGGREREWGSVALSICAVARGGLGTFIQGNSHSHDHLAALLIAKEAGVDIVLHSKIETEVVDVVVSHPSLSHEINKVFEFRTNL